MHLLVTCSYLNPKVCYRLRDRGLLAKPTHGDIIRFFHHQSPLLFSALMWSSECHSSLSLKVVGWFCLSAIHIVFYFFQLLAGHIIFFNKQSIKLDFLFGFARCPNILHKNQIKLLPRLDLRCPKVLPKHWIKFLSSRFASSLP